MLSAFALAIRNLRTKSRSEPSALYGKGVAGLQQQDFHLGAGLREERSWAVLDAFYNLFRCG
jgi:hypothetical protein